MSRLIRLGDQFLVKLQLPDRITDRFIRARVFNSALTEVAFSPLALTHIADGLYANVAQQATAIGNYTVQYTVYNDAGFTQLSNKYATVEEDVFVFNFDQNILTAVQAIPTNPLLTNDARLDNLAEIPNRLSTADYNTGKTEIINNITSNTDDSDGRAV